MIKLYSSQGREDVGTFPGRGKSKWKHLELERNKVHVPGYKEDTQ